MEDIDLGHQYITQKILEGDDGLKLKDCKVFICYDNEQKIVLILKERSRKAKLGPISSHLKNKVVSLRTHLRSKS